MSSPDGRYRLSVCTSMLSEFRNASGALGAFELSSRYASVGSFCSALARVSGVHFEDVGPSLWAPRNRFTFKNRAFEVSVPFNDVRVEPVEMTAGPYTETEELLRVVREQVLPIWQARARSRWGR